MPIPDDMKRLLIELANKLPADARTKFTSGPVRDRLDAFASSSLMKWTLCGAAIGAVLDGLPLVDDCMEVGGALGAWVGYCIDEKERKQRDQIRQIIVEEIRNALV